MSEMPEGTGCIGAGSFIASRRVTATKLWIYYLVRCGTRRSATPGACRSLANFRKLSFWCVRPSTYINIAKPAKIVIRLRIGQVELTLSPCSCGGGSIRQAARSISVFGLCGPPPDPQSIASS